MAAGSSECCLWRGNSRRPERARWSAAHVLAAGVILLVLCTTGVSSQQLEEVTASSVAELLEALRTRTRQIRLVAPLQFQPEDFPVPFVIDRPVTLVAPVTQKMDFGLVPGRVLFNVTASGSLEIVRVFLRNFLPSSPQALAGRGPVPALLSSGGLITFRFCGMHFLPNVTWVFSAPVDKSFWARAAAGAALLDVLKASPLQLNNPATYLIRFASDSYAFAQSYALLDLHSCYSDNREDTALVYCLYTFADSLRNSRIRTAHVFHDVGLDRATYDRRSPVIVPQAMTVAACPGSSPVLNMDTIISGIVVQSPIEFQGIRFRGSSSTIFTSWPPSLSLLPSAFHLDASASISLVNCTVEVPSLTNVVAALKALPGCCTDNPARPNLQPTVEAWPSDEDFSCASSAMDGVADADDVATALSDSWDVVRIPAGTLLGSNANASANASLRLGDAHQVTDLPGFIIKSWTLSMNAWRQYASTTLSDVVSEPSSATYRFSQVAVIQEDLDRAALLCFPAALEQGLMAPGSVVRVSNDAELRVALAYGTRYIQVTSDIRLDPANWPTGAAALTLGAGVSEVRACHPVLGRRYTLDLSELGPAMRITGRLLLQGDLRIIHVGWANAASALAAAVRGSSITVGESPDPGSGSRSDQIQAQFQIQPMAAFTVVSRAGGGAGSLEAERVEIVGVLDSTTLSLGPSDILSVMRLSNMTSRVRQLNATLYGNAGIILGQWAVNLNDNSNGAWVFTETVLLWSTPTTNFSTASTAGGGGGDDGGGGAVSTLAIALPVALGGAALVAVAAAAFILVRRRRNAAAAAAPPGAKSSAAAAAAACKGGSSHRTYGGGGIGGANGSLATVSSAEVELGAIDGCSDRRDTHDPASSANGGGGGGGGFHSSGLGNSDGAASRVLASPAAAAAMAAVMAAPLPRPVPYVESVSTASAAVNGGGGGGGGYGATGTATTERAATATGTGAAAGTGANTGAVGGLQPSPSNGATAPLMDIDAARRAIAAGRPAVATGAHGALDDLVLQSVLGEGSYGRVYRALWRGTTVAVKVILLPPHMSGRERHERMAVMEAAISSSLSHPNIVQTYTYSVECVEGKRRGLPSFRPAQHDGTGASLRGDDSGDSGAPSPHGRSRGGGAGGSASHASWEAGSPAAEGPDIVGWEIRLVQEFCDMGSLRDKLNERVFLRPAPGGVAAQGPGSSGAVAGGGPHADAMAARLHTFAGAGSNPASQPASPRAGPPGPGTGPGTAYGTANGTARGPGADSPSARGSTGVVSPLGTGLAAGLGVGTTTAPVLMDSRSVNAAAATGSDCGSKSGSKDRDPVMVVDLAGVLDTAIDVARAVAHLHREGIVHADLKPRNVLLRGSTSDPRGFVAKVADFGLSLRLDTNETHVSNAYHGTLAYMAPETLLNGHVSRASDVYAFGILLFELYTGDTAFRGVNKALIGHAIAKDNLRPVFPPALAAPFEFQLLACRCWESNPEIRPDFDFILDELKRMRARLCGLPSDASAGLRGLAAAGAACCSTRGGGGAGGLPSGGNGDWGLPLRPTTAGQHAGGLPSMSYMPRAPAPGRVTGGGFPAAVGAACDASLTDSASASNSLSSLSGVPVSGVQVSYPINAVPNGAAPPAGYATGVRQPVAGPHVSGGQAQAHQAQAQPPRSQSPGPEGMAASPFVTPPAAVRYGSGPSHAQQGQAKGPAPPSGSGQIVGTAGAPAGPAGPSGASRGWQPGQASGPSLVVVGEVEEEEPEDEEAPRSL